MKRKNITILILLILTIVILWIINWEKSRKVEKLNNNSILIGLGQCFKLLEGEDTVNLKNYKINQDYWYLYVRETDQVLNKVIKGKETNFYIWLSFTQPNNFIRQQNADTSLKTIANKDFIINNQKYYSFFLKRKDKFFSRTLYVTPEGKNIIIIDIPDYDSLKVFNFFRDTTFVIKRITC